MYQKITPEHEREIISRRLAGEPSKSIAQAFNVCHATILRKVKSHGIFGARALRYNHKKPLKKCDENAFSVVTNESAYWAGFLMADGCIYNNCVILELADVDIGHLQKFKNFLKSEHAISKTRSGHKISVMHPKLAHDLAGFGVVPRKTFSAKASDGMAMNLNFIRGLIDGDGSLWMKVRHNRSSSPEMNLCGSRSICEQFLFFVKTVLPDCRATVRKTGNIFVVSLSSRPAQTIVKALYKNAPVYLDRKMTKAKEILAHRFSYAERNPCYNLAENQKP